MGIVLENSGIYIDLTFDAAAEQFDGDLIEATLENEDKDQVTFADVKGGLTKDAFMNIKGVQDTSTGSLWRLLWDNPGAEIAVKYGPNGNALASADDPHVVGTLKASGRPTLGTAAGVKAKKGEFDYSLQFIDGPELDTGA